MEKCVYCGKALPENKLMAKVHTRSFGVCCEECRARTERYVQLDRRFKTALYLLVFAGGLGFMISAFFGGVVEGLKAAFAPVGELFTPLKPVFDWLGEKLQAAWQWFKNLIAPVKATQDTLNRCRDTGVMFGQALADALMLPLNAFNKLRSGIDWVLEKLGVINKESDTLDQTAARTQAATYGSGGYIPATSSYAGYQAYQPVTAPAGRSYVDQSKNEYHISLTGGTAPGTQLDRQLQDALEKYERDKRARARASMMHDG